jgi:hypothetical protein
MSGICLSGVCRGGPWDGQFYHHCSRNPQLRAFQYAGPGNIRGTYTFGADNTGSFWHWQPGEVRQ